MVQDPGILREAESQLELLRRGAVQIVSEEELRDRLAAAIAARRPLRVKLGADPTAPDIHLGHTVVLRKLRQFQDLGHEVYFVIGDFTGRIGDPTDKSETRRQLSAEEVAENARTYETQVFKILDPRRTRVTFNSEWLAPLRFEDVVRLAAGVTVARLLERDDFARRFREERPISLHEFFYPLMQGYDSVALRIDVELGGTDQTFNILMARQIQRHYGLEPEILMSMPLLEGLDGVQKMSKSLGNYIGIDEPPEEMYGKAMSLPDALIARYLELVTDVPLAEIRTMERDMAAGRLNPRDAKMRLAREIVRLYHGAAAAEAAEAHFRRVFQRRELPEEMPEVRLQPGLGIVEMLCAAGLAASKSEARRLVAEGAVRLDGARVAGIDGAPAWEDGAVLQVGRRRFVRLRRA
ncbi:MAG: tyrosine--tRNA ligase [Firmicutes bacterium]|nr:tyrosine--tRNA ligase [Bacillota bacterium]